MRTSRSRVGNGVARSRGEDDEGGEGRGGEGGRGKRSRETHLLVVRLLNTLLGDNSVKNELDGDSTGNSDGKSLVESEGGRKTGQRGR